MNQILTKKINRLQGICSTIRKHLKKTRTDTQMKFYKVVARPSLLYGSETWVTVKRHDLPGSCISGYSAAGAGVVGTAALLLVFVVVCVVVVVMGVVW